MLTLDQILEEMFSKEFISDWESVIPIEQASEENRDENLRVILGLIDKLAPRAVQLVKNMCEAETENDSLMYYIVKRILASQVLQSLQIFRMSLEQSEMMTDEDLQKELAWTNKPIRELSLMFGHCDTRIRNKALPRTDLNDL